MLASAVRTNVFFEAKIRMLSHLMVFPTLIGYKKFLAILGSAWDIGLLVACFVHFN